MTPQERQLVDDLFDRLSKVEGAPRDPDAIDAISQGQRRAPNALYALVQTVLLQDEALKRANARIQELEGHGQEAAQPPGGFLDSMRDALFGQSQPGGQTRGSVPNVPAPGGRPVWNSGQVMSQQTAQGGYGQGGGYGQPQYGGQPSYGQPAPGGGGSFLGTAAAAAAGMVGGSLLLGSIRSMMGGSHQGFGDSFSGGGESRNPWSTDSSGGSLARDAGVNDIGTFGQRADASGAGAFDQAQADADQDQDQDQDDGDFDNDPGSSDGGNFA